MLINNLFSDTLELDIRALLVDQTKPHGNNTDGVVKVELTSTEDRIAILRAKLKCDAMPEDKCVSIKNCESHTEHVARINNKLILQKLDLKSEYIITVLSEQKRI